MLQPLGNSTVEVPGNFKIEPPYDPAVLILGIYPKEVRAGSQKEICTPMFTAALLTVGKRQKQPVYPPVENG